MQRLYSQWCYRIWWHCPKLLLAVILLATVITTLVTMDLASKPQKTWSPMIRKEESASGSLPLSIRNDCATRRRATASDSLSESDSGSSGHFQWQRCTTSRSTTNTSLLPVRILVIEPQPTVDSNAPPAVDNRASLGVAPQEGPVEPLGQSASATAPSPASLNADDPDSEGSKNGVSRAVEKLPVDLQRECRQSETVHPQEPPVIEPPQAALAEVEVQVAAVGTMMAARKGQGSEKGTGNSLPVAAASVASHAESWLLWHMKPPSSSEAGRSTPPESLTRNPGPSAGARLYYARMEKWIGILHWRRSFLCTAAEARALNRTLVLSRWIGITSTHSLKGTWERHRIEQYIDMEYVRSRQPLQYLEDLQSELHCNDLENITCVRQHMSVVTVSFTTPTKSLAKLPNTSLVMRRKDQYAWNYLLCEWLHKGELTDWKDPSLVRPPAPLRHVIESMRAAMGGDYDAVHVRRGDKLQDPDRWPHLDSDTRPQALVQKLSKLLRPGRNLYIASNEKTPGYFDPLKHHFKVHTLADFKSLWARGSRWEVETKMDLVAFSQARTLAEMTVEFDAFMEVIVDYEVVDGARTQLETFNDLTSDPRDGCPSDKSRRRYHPSCLA